jgi:hypothetical protein
MERAGEAMQQIHGKLNIDKVDETMYVLPAIQGVKWEVLTLFSREKLPKLLRVHLSANLSTRLSWMMSWQNLNKSNLTIRC